LTKKIKWGTVEIDRHSPVGKNHITDRNAGDVFGYLPLVSKQVEIKLVQPGENS
jgi:hypothetical protein